MISGMTRAKPQNPAHFQPRLQAGDGKLLASGTDDGRVVLWEAASGQKLRDLGSSLSGERGRVRSVVFNPEGNRLAASRGARIVV